MESVNIRITIIADELLEFARYVGQAGIWLNFVRLGSLVLALSAVFSPRSLSNGWEPLQSSFDFAVIALSQVE